MNTFISNIANDLIERFGTNLAHIAVVFPNKRAALFLNQELAKIADGPIWSPAYITISELFRQQSNLTVADPIKSLCDLYKSYTSITGRNEDLDEFYGWGQLLLADFDDIDKNMADAKQLFSNVQNIHELDTIDYLSDHQKEELQRFFANFTGDTSILRERFITLWSKLYDVYNDFKARLSRQGLAYEGMLYREVIESDNIPSQYDQYLFIGFNVLQKVEQKLFASLQKEGKAQFYWDYDNYYFKGFNEAGVYIKRWLEIFPNSLENRANPLYDCFEKEKDIQFISAPTENLQARYITEWLRENNRYKDGKRTAIVMCDENLLKTVIHCVPPEVDSINVTTGFPLQQAPISSMISQLITLQTDGYSVRENAFKLHYVNRILRHPYGKYITDEAEELLQKFNETKQFYIKTSDNSIFRHIPHDKSHMNELVSWLAQLTRTIATNGVDYGNPLFQESTFRMYTLLNRLSELMEQGDLIADFVVFRRLLSQLISSTSIPFHGEPAKGVQVMGVLETRNLDFDHVLLLSCNEGNMPKGVDDVSFIPHLIRKAYGLITIDNKVSIYSYYFHSILQRAKDVTILYNNSTQGSKTGEMSRFMLQLLVELNQPIQRLALQAGQEPMKWNTVDIEKDSIVEEKLNQISYFSPTAINSYLRCPLIFYYKYITGLSEPIDNDEDDIDNRIFGNIFHYAAQLMYEQLLPKERITKENIEYVLKTGKSAQSMTETNGNTTLDSVITEAFARELFQFKPGTKKHPKLNGLQIINREVIEKYLRRLLRLDMKTAPMRVIRHEFDVYKEITIKVKDKEKQLSIGGRIDRLDEIDLNSPSSRLRVVDYKTGNKVAKELKSVDEIFNPDNILEKKSDYTLQAMLYSIIETTDDKKYNQHHQPVSPALLFIQHSGGEDYTPVLSLGGNEIVNATEYADEFYPLLIEKLEEIFNIEVPFRPTTKIKTCEYCPYKMLCGR